jgi:hypothetical protein
MLHAAYAARFDIMRNLEKKIYFLELKGLNEVEMQHAWDGTCRNQSANSGGR